MLADNSLVEDSCCAQRHSYDEKGLPVKQESVNIQGNVLGATVNTFYENGLYRTIQWLDSGGRESYREDFTIDPSGKYVSGITYQVSKKSGSFSIPEQNEYGNWTKLDWYDTLNTLTRKEEYKFNGEKLVEQIWLDKNGVITSNRTFEHNDKGDEVLVKLHTKIPGTDSTTVKVTKYKYEGYDQYDNWVQRTTLDKDDKVKKIVRRSFTYWKQ